MKAVALSPEFDKARHTIYNERMITQKMRTAETSRFDVYAAERSCAPAYAFRLLETSREHICSRRFRTFEKTHAPVFKNAILCMLGVSLLAIFVSCATVRPRGIRYPVHVTNARVVDLLPPDDIAFPIEGLYMFTASFGTSSFYMQAFIQANEGGIFINLLNDFGSDMGTLTYTGSELSLASAVLPASLKAQYIVADIQFAYYDAGAVAESLCGAGLDFIVTKDGDIELRRIMNGKKCIEEISITSSSVSIINHLRGYEYHLTEAL